MRERGRSRQIIALAAAYVVALQALLLPLSLAAGASPDFSLCSAATSTAGPQSGGGHDGSGCPCAAGCGMQCCVHALAGPPQAVIVLALTSTAWLTPPPAFAQVARPWLRSPQLARAPPAA
jgi:hypothetical protein